jgi:Acetyltransferase (GNAT) domain
LHGLAVAESPAAGTSRKRGVVTIEPVESSRYPQWEAFVRSSPGGSAYALPAYLTVLCKAIGASFTVLAATRGDEIVGGAAVVERRRRAGTSVAPRPLLHYNGFVLSDYATRYPSERTARRFEVVAALAAALEARDYGRLEFRHDHDIDDVRALQAHGWSVKPSYSYVVPLTDLEAQWQSVDQNLRRLVDRAKREGLELDVACDPAELYRLHHDTDVRKGSGVYLPRDLFLTFVSDLCERGIARVYGARTNDGRVAAAQLVLLGHKNTHTVVAAGDAELRQMGANPFLRWSAFEHLAASGAVANDLTDATPGPVERFKSQLGGRLVTAYVTQRLSPAYRVQLWAYHGLRRGRARLKGRG